MVINQPMCLPLDLDLLHVLRYYGPITCDQIVASFEYRNGLAGSKMVKKDVTEKYLHNFIEANRPHIRVMFTCDLMQDLS
jgi:hypothetical protein